MIARAAASTGAFFDTNVLLHLLSADTAKADRAEELLASGGTISVQVLNELVTLARERLQMEWDAIGEVTAAVRSLCAVLPLTTEIHDRGLELARSMGTSVSDSMIMAAALASGASLLYSENLEHGRTIEGRVRIHNPF